jgi:hypothetical protein
MDPFSIVKDFNPLKYLGFSILQIFILFMVNMFCLKGIKETLHGCMIPAVSFTAHALNEAVSIIFAGILTPPVRVDKEPFGGFARPKAISRAPVTSSHMVGQAPT